MAVEVAGAAAEEVPGAGAALDCCGLGAGEATLANVTNAGVEVCVDADAPDAQTENASKSEAAIGSLIIFLRGSSLPRAGPFREGSVRRAYICLL